MSVSTNLILKIRGIVCNFHGVHPKERKLIKRQRWKLLAGFGDMPPRSFKFLHHMDLLVYTVICIYVYI